MPTNKVVTRIRKTEQIGDKDFNFNPELVPGLSSNGNLPKYIHDYRQRAWEIYLSLPFPVASDEAWRRTDLRGFKPDKYWIPEGNAVYKLPEIPKNLKKSLAGDKCSGQILLLPGGTSKVQLAAELASKGVIFTDLKTAVKEHADILAHTLGQVVKPVEGKFAALASAMAQTGVLVYVPHNIQIDYPLHSIIWGPGTNLAYISHILVWLEEGSSLTYVHEAASPTELNGQGMHSGIVEIHVGEAASFRFVELQSWGKHVWNFSHERARVNKDGNLEWIFGAVGSHLTKNFSNIDLIGQGATGRMSGFYFTDEDQHLDHDTMQNHLAPHTTSDLLFKGALKDRSRSVWQGMIYVAPGARKTDGYQANRNLTLSSHARADSIPGLEILADDVRCSHGVTVGKIDSDQIFYLMSRGIPKNEAERLIVEGFFEPIMQRIPFEGVRRRFQKTIKEKMEL